MVVMTMKAESEGRIYRSHRDPEHVIPRALESRVVVVRPRHRLGLSLIESRWPRIEETIELGRRRAAELLLPLAAAGAAQQKSGQLWQ